MVKVNNNEMRNIDARAMYPYILRCGRCRKPILGTGRTQFGALINAYINYKAHLKRFCR